MNNYTTERVNAKDLKIGDIVRFGNMFDEEYTFAKVNVAEKRDGRTVRIGYYADGSYIVAGNQTKYVRVTINN